jgi:hypothetical protein
VTVELVAETVTQVLQTSAENRAVIRRFLAGGPAPEALAAGPGPGSLRTGARYEAEVVEGLPSSQVSSERVPAPPVAGPPDPRATGHLSGGSGGALEDALVRIERKVDGLLAAGRSPERKEPLVEGECLRVFHLFGELLAMGTELVASPARVFDLMVFRKLTKTETAVACKCAASLITRRVATLEGHFGMPVEKLCDFASDIKERQRTVRGDRYAQKKRGAVRDELEQAGDGELRSLEEDDGGYLPEEGQGDE